MLEAFEMFTAKIFYKPALMVQTAFSKYLVNIGINVWSSTEKVGKLG